MSDASRDRLKAALAAAKARDAEIETVQKKLIDAAEQARRQVQDLVHSYDTVLVPRLNAAVQTINGELAGMGKFIRSTNASPFPSFGAAPLREDDISLLVGSEHAIMKVILQTDGKLVIGPSQVTGGTIAQNYSNLDGLTQGIAENAMRNFAAYYFENPEQLKPR